MAMSANMPGFLTLRDTQTSTNPDLRPVDIAVDGGPFVRHLVQITYMS